MRKLDLPQGKQVFTDYDYLKIALGKPPLGDRIVNQSSNPIEIYRILVESTRVIS